MSEFYAEHVQSSVFQCAHHDNLHQRRVCEVEVVGTQLSLKCRIWTLEAILNPCLQSCIIGPLMHDRQCKIVQTVLL